VIVNRANLTILNTAFRAAFQGGLSQAPSQYADISTVVPSTTAVEEYGWLGPMHGLREWLGDRVVHGVSEYGYAVKNRKFELTESVPRDKIEDDQYGVFTPLMAEMGRATAAHPDELVFGLLKDGRNALCYDGTPFFGEAHPVALPSGKIGAQSNIDDGSGGSGAWYVMDLSRSLRPMIFQNRKADNFVAKTAETDENVFNADAFVWGVDNRRNAGFGFWQMAQSSTKELNAANLKAAVAKLQTRKGDHGRPLGLRATHLAVPAGLEFQALELLATQRNAAGASNVLNGRLQIIASPWLDD
jgi:phage major head subunit gpT-like protein